jgi:pilus assembly protein CpaF
VNNGGETIDKKDQQMSNLPPEYTRLIEDTKRVLEQKFAPEVLERMEITHLRKEIDDAIRQLAGPQATGPVRDVIRTEVEFRVAGLGVLDKLLLEPGVSDILINGTDNIYVERGGRLEETQYRFEKESDLGQVIHRIIRRVGRDFDPDVPMIDVRLHDGSRANIVLPPLVLGGPVLSIRRFSKQVSSAADLVRHGTLPAELLDFFEKAVRGKLNILIIGGTGTGKTTMLNVLSSLIPEGERIVTLEDAAELQLNQKHVVRMETKPGFGGKPTVGIRDLFKNSLRMRPDRIIIGEVRGGEVLDMLQAMNTGHEGSMATLHANNPRDALIRIEALLRISGIELPESALSQLLSRSFHLILQLARLQDGRRVIQSVHEIVGREANTITMQELFTFQAQGVDKQGRVIGQFRSTGIRPHFYEKIKHLYKQ